ncbi:MAG TPA: ribonuclease R [Sedimentisphaerales bacterium]|jgi:ribonuclease R|nr:ribonuclease R [Sedimentisphaerales bacterium]HNU30072.1 ribonuclease R [Sedimentisphaerales bacterium]
MAQVYKDRILKFLKRQEYQPLKLAQLARALGVDDDAYEEFKTAFDDLRRAGHVLIGSGNVITLPAMAGQVVGTFRANAKGFGFVCPLEPNAHGDLFIPPDATADAMNGDTVLAKVNRKGRHGSQVRCSGEVLRILERANNRFVGTLIRHPESWIVQPDGSAFTEPIVIEDVAAKNAREKDKVVVEILSYPRERYLARGVIVEVLGRAGQYDAEIASILRQFHLPSEFEADCLEQARSAAASFDPERADSREDITDKVIVTIDPPDAKDFDDAISLEMDSQGHWVLGVHIADVSHFIPKDSPLDDQARERGNSIYLPGKTIPMLPEVLSNGICSLQPDQKRFTKSAFITYDDKGDILSRRYANTVIRSTARLTYLEADGILKGHTKGAKREVIELLRNMDALSRRIEARRTEHGMIHLDLPEPELIFDDAGRVVDAEPKENCYPHTIIEMFMVEANDAVASLLDRQNVPFMRRIHPEPDVLSMKNMARLLRAMGVPSPKSPDRKAIQDILEHVKDSERALAVNLVVLRSLERAVYAPTSIGHYALASTHYCHFTSPIRRYADLLVHRVLQCYLEGRIDTAKQEAAGEDLNAVGQHITFTEERADDAERELTSVLILQMLSKHIGDEMDCVVTGLTGFGIFVQSQKYGIDGLIKFEDLGSDEWRFNKVTQCVMGERSGEMIRLGQPMRVHIIAVNVPARQLNVAPVEPLGQRREAPKPKKREKKARAERRSKADRKPKAKKKRRK